LAKKRDFIEFFCFPSVVPGPTGWGRARNYPYILWLQAASPQKATFALNPKKLAFFYDCKRAEVGPCEVFFNNQIGWLEFRCGALSVTPLPVASKKGVKYRCLRPEICGAARLD
jgi:hypothetical protein